jgi:hypothetical protein
MRIICYFFLLLSLLCPPAMAKQFEIFDGQIYNGLYYPLVDIIEWGEQDHELPHLEFHIHSKDKPVDLSVVAGDKNGKPVLWIMYDLKFRSEHVCRHVLAPLHFREGMKLYVYRDNSDPDYDNIYVYSQPWTKKGRVPASDYAMPAYERCSDEQASNMPEKPGAKPAGAAAAPVPEARAPASKPAPAEPGKDTKGLPADYGNDAVPFSF